MTADVQQVILYDRVIGTRTDDGPEVYLIPRSGDKEDLDPRHDLLHAAPFFEWGYRGSGPRQLALALLAAAKNDHAALELHLDYHRSVTSELPEEWVLRHAEITAWLTGKGLEF